MSTRPQNRIDQLLSTDGLGTLANANAITQGEYTFKPAKTAYLMRMLILVEDAPNVDPGNYGSGVLTNGILLTVKSANDAVLHNFTPSPLKRINDWGLLAGPDLPETDLAIVTIRFTFTKGSEVLAIQGGEGEYLSLELQEDATGLTAQYCQVQGYYTS